MKGEAPRWAFSSPESALFHDFLFSLHYTTCVRCGDTINNFNRPVARGLSTDSGGGCIPDIPLSCCPTSSSLYVLSLARAVGQRANVFICESLYNAESGTFTALKDIQGTSIYSLIYCDSSSRTSDGFRCSMSMDRTELSRCVIAAIPL